MPSVQEQLTALVSALKAHARLPNEGRQGQGEGRGELALYLTTQVCVGVRCSWMCVHIVCVGGEGERTAGAGRLTPFFPTPQRMYHTHALTHTRVLATYPTHLP